MERLRRLPQVVVHPTLYNAALVYDSGEGQDAMSSIYAEYIQAAAKAHLPMLMTSPTWRLDAERIAEAEPSVPSTINTDAVNYMLDVRDKFKSSDQPPVLIGALVGPKNDCYKPKIAPNANEAESFHSDQINELAQTDADFLQALTLPSVAEGLGIARAMSATGKDYVISFCVGTDGHVLDGTPLPEAFEMIDNGPQVKSPPTAYYVNCSHPSFLLKRYNAGSSDLDRLKGIQANGSSLDVTSLDDSTCTHADPVDQWAAAMSRLHDEHNVTILGGCCGTSLPHFEALAQILNQ